MFKLTLSLKHFIFTGRPHLWPNYLVLAGVCFKILLAPHIPVVLAEQSLYSNYGMSTIEAVQTPNPKNLSLNVNEDDENNFILSGSFVNPNYLMYSSYKLFAFNQAQKSQRVNQGNYRSQHYGSFNHF